MNLYISRSDLQSLQFCKHKLTQEEFRDIWSPNFPVLSSLLVLHIDISLKECKPFQRVLSYQYVIWIALFTTAFIASCANASFKV